MVIPPVHPAVPAAAHLLPGIKAWSTSVAQGIAGLDLQKLGVLPASLTSFEAVKNWYISTDPLHSSLTFAAFLSAFAFVLGQATNNASTVDRMWATLPAIYSAHFAMHSHWTSAGRVAQLFGGKSTGGSSLFSKIVPSGVDDRMFLVFLLQILWSIRLTGNTLRRGFFDFKAEDYRWPYVRKIMPRWLWVFFDLTFISITQNVLLLSTALTQYLLLTSTRAYHPSTATTPLGWPDFAIAGLFVANLLVEQTADLQQQAFQNWKHGKAMKEGKGARMLAGASARQVEVDEGHLRRGFVTSGLWAWSRHPNFLCEQLNFWILSLFTWRATVPHAVFEEIWQSAKASLTQRQPEIIIRTIKAASPHLFNYSWYAAIAMTSLFISSTTLTEWISNGKYPKYRAYQRRVGMFLPSMTLVKATWLAITGQLATVNEEVWGSGKAKTT
ncbi:hypothetical protein EMMF5_005243 [Cystobasidiomycetes sp. EMM_F5]